MTKVWVTNYNGQDLSAAEEQFGKDRLILITEGRVNTFQTNNLWRDLTRRMESFEADDCLLVCGSPIINMVVALILKSRGFDEVRVQIFHQKEKRYLERSLQLGKCFP